MSIQELQTQSGSSADMRNVPTSQPMTQFAADPSQVSPLHVSNATSVDNMCDENIQLFIRCEEYAQQENELGQTVAKLKKELEENKRRNEQFAAYIETRKKQKLLFQPVGKRPY